MAKKIHPKNSKIEEGAGNFNKNSKINGQSCEKLEVKIKNRRKGEGEVGNEGIFEQGVNECVCINGMEWNENVCETEGPKIERQKKQRRILPTWILEGKKSTPKDNKK